MVKRGMRSFPRAFESVEAIAIGDYCTVIIKSKSPSRGVQTAAHTALAQSIKVLCASTAYWKEASSSALLTPYSRRGLIALHTMFLHITGLVLVAREFVKVQFLSFPRSLASGVFILFLIGDYVSYADKRKERVFL